eukprot:GHVQ01002282.1.p1 GENE.GHVQ01002282.1~~GHVQ01002282.1.p1  ORF type:complete len:428 (+),score=45.91 GHVQ01002282.1:239-1522(+)
MDSGETLEAIPHNPPNTNSLRQYDNIDRKTLKLRGIEQSSRSLSSCPSPFGPSRMDDTLRTMVLDRLRSGKRADITTPSTSLIWTYRLKCLSQPKLFVTTENCYALSMLYSFKNVVLLLIALFVYSVFLQRKRGRGYETDERLDSTITDHHFEPTEMTGLEHTEVKVSGYIDPPQDVQSFSVQGHEKSFSEDACSPSIAPKDEGAESWDANEWLQTMLDAMEETLRRMVFSIKMSEPPLQNAAEPLKSSTSVSGENAEADLPTIEEYWDRMHHYFARLKAVKRTDTSIPFQNSEWLKEVYRAKQLHEESIVSDAMLQESRKKGDDLSAVSEPPLQNAAEPLISDDVMQRLINGEVLSADEVFTVKAESDESEIYLNTDNDFGVSSKEDMNTLLDSTVPAAASSEKSLLLTKLMSLCTAGSDKEIGMT